MAKREQRRLFWLVMTLGLVLLLMHEAAKPVRWYWIWGGQPPAEQAAEARIDTRLPGNAQGVADAGTFIARLPQAVSVADEQFFPGVEAALLAGVRDDAVFVGGDHAAFFHLLDVLQQADPARLAAASTGEVSFVQIYKQPAEYRGRLVTLRGTIRRASWRDAPANEHGIDGYYHTVLQPIGRQDNPIVVYCLDLPEGFPQGDDVRADGVTLTGFFFKRWAYRSSDGIRTAPLLLARGLDWQPAIREEPLWSDSRNIVWITGLCVAAAVAVAALVAMLTLRGHSGSVGRRSVDRNETAAWAGISAGPGPEEMMRRLEQEAAGPRSRVEPGGGD